MTSAFISYSSDNLPVADFIAGKLRNRGVDVFIDYQRLQSGNFVEQLGVKIEQQAYFVVVISPYAVEESKWVKAEVTWAFIEKETDFIIPIWYKPAKLTKLFVLAGLERVDFTRWDVDRNMDDDIQKLCRLMSIPFEPQLPQPVPEPMLNGSSVHKESEDEEDLFDESSSPKFAKGDVAKIFQSAADAQAEDPEKALFLYQQALEIDPDFMGGHIKGFVERQQENLLPARLHKLEQRIESAKEKGKWTEAIQLSNTMLDLDTDNFYDTQQYATQQVALAEENQECEPVYQQARIACESDNLDAAKAFFEYVQQTCPEFGDPAKVLTNQPITKDMLGYLRNSHTLKGHTRAINRVGFSNDGSMLATASSDCSVKVWSSSTGDMLVDLKEHTGRVASVAFSPDDKYLASASNDGKVILWDCSTWGVKAVKEMDHKPSEIAFFRNRNALITGGNSDRLYILNVPDLAEAKVIKARNMPKVQTEKHSNSLVNIQRSRTTQVTSISCANDGLLACSIWEQETASEESFLPTISFASSLRSWSQSQSSIKVWNTCNWEKRDIKSPTTTTKIRQLALSNDGAYLAHSTNELHIRKLPRGRPYHSIENSPRIFDLTFSAIDSSLLLWADDGPEASRINFFDLDAKRTIAWRNAHEDVINSIAMSPDGRFIVTGSDDCTARIWQL